MPRISSVSSRSSRKAQAESSPPDPQPGSGGGFDEFDNVAPPTESDFKIQSEYRSPYAGDVSLVNTTVPGDRTGLSLDISSVTAANTPLKDNGGKSRRGGMYHDMQTDDLDSGSGSGESLGEEMEEGEAPGPRAPSPPKSPVALDRGHKGSVYVDAKANPSSFNDESDEEDQEEQEVQVQKTPAQQTSLPADVDVNDLDSDSGESFGRVEEDEDVNEEEEDDKNDKRNNIEEEEPLGSAPTSPIAPVTPKVKKIDSETSLSGSNYLSTAQVTAQSPLSPTSNEEDSNSYSGSDSDEENYGGGDDSPAENDSQFKMAISTATSLQTQLAQAHHQIETLLTKLVASRNSNKQLKQQIEIQKQQSVTQVEKARSDSTILVAAAHEAAAKSQSKTQAEQSSKILALQSTNDILAVEVDSLKLGIETKDSEIKSLKKQNKKLRDSKNSASTPPPLPKPTPLEPQPNPPAQTPPRAPSPAPAVDMLKLQHLERENLSLTTNLDNLQATLDHQKQLAALVEKTNLEEMKAKSHQVEQQTMLANTLTNQIAKLKLMQTKTEGKMVSEITKAKRDLKEALAKIKSNEAKIDKQAQDLKNATKQRSNMTQQLRVTSNNLKETQTKLTETEKKRQKGLEILKAYKTTQEDRHKKHVAKEAELQASFMTAKSGLKFSSAVREKQICKILQRCLIRVRICRDEAKRAAGKDLSSSPGNSPVNNKSNSPIASGDNDGNDDGSHRSKNLAEGLETALDELLQAFHESVEHKIHKERTTMQSAHDAVVEKLASSLASQPSPIANVSNITSASASNAKSQSKPTGGLPLSPATPTSKKIAAVATPVRTPVTTPANNPTTANNARMAELSAERDKKTPTTKKSFTSSIASIAGGLMGGGGGQKKESPGNMKVAELETKPAVKQQEAEALTRQKPAPAPQSAPAPSPSPAPRAMVMTPAPAPAPAQPMRPMMPAPTRVTQASQGNVNGGSPFDAFEAFDAFGAAGNNSTSQNNASLHASLGSLGSFENFGGSNDSNPFDGI
ncbi:hypothetical protein TrST_g6415 [Triparma strigata]|uniref:Uncharacterized protein n=1 Tax=Triparma strigata TaxID=1606541 RepID=A0A9W7C0C9_9STRA|nr:hypothetical protein TrST_g6415 [Triparma strigata]